MLEAQYIVGGNTVTEELTLPGFLHDSCSSAHVLIQSNPVLRDDELGLLSTYGLSYVFTDPAVVLPLPSGTRSRCTATWTRRSRSWRASRGADAEELRAMMREWDGGLGAAPCPAVVR